MTSQPQVKHSTTEPLHASNFYLTYGIINQFFGWSVIKLEGEG